MHFKLERRSTRPDGIEARPWPGLICALLAWLFGLCQVFSAAADTPAGSARSTVLHLTNGGYVPGELSPSSQPGLLRWQSNQFRAPFDFALTAVNAVHFPVLASLPEPTG